MIQSPDMTQGNVENTFAEVSRAPDLQALTGALSALVPILESESLDAERAARHIAEMNRRLVELCMRERVLAAPPALPRILEILQRPLPDKELYEDALRDLEAQAGQRFAAPSAFVEFQFNWLLIDAICTGLDHALAAMVRRLMAAPYDLWKDPMIDKLGAFFVENRWLDGPLTETRAAVRKAANAKARPEAVGKLLTLTQVVGFSVGARLEWLEFLFQSLVMPALRLATKARLYDAALKLEWFAYMRYTKARDDAEHFAQTVSQWVPLLRRCGKAFGAGAPRVKRLAAASRPLKVAFYLHNSDSLGHTEALMSFFRGLSQLDAPPIEAVLYTSGAPNADLDRQLRAYGVTGVYLKALAKGGGATTDELAAMRDDIRRREVVTVVYVSLVLTMPFAFSMPLAQVQIWWSMKYHSLEFAEIDGYMALGSFDDYREIDGRSWRAVHRAMAPLFDPSLGAEASRIRRELLGDGGTVLFGCIGREEKLADETYIATVAHIMDAVSGSVFVWTGQRENPQVVALLEKYGIRGRSRFVGWIDTRLYAQVLDIFLDSFPFASGLTAFEAMAAERPVVAMLTRESLGTGMPTHVWPAYRGEVGTPEIQEDVRAIFTDDDGGTLLPFAETVDEYRRFALRLSTDTGYRARVGAAMAEFVRRYMVNDVLMAESGCRHIVEITDTALDRT